MVQLLLGHGTDANSEENDEYAPPGEAALSGESEIVRLLLGAGADVNRKTREEVWTPFFGAVLENDL